MKLDFSILTVSASTGRGQREVVGTSRIITDLPSLSSGDIHRNTGDKTTLSPNRPHAQKLKSSANTPMSHMSPIVPTLAIDGAKAAKLNSDSWQERAAIMEYEGGLSRADAEVLATVLERVGLNTFYQ